MKGADHIIIAIDGPAGAGKSTVAKMVGERLSLLYIDSGAMYRAMAWKALREGIDPLDEGAVTDMARDTRIELKPSGDISRVFADGEEVTGLIRTPEVTEASSKLATIAPIREILVGLQQAMGRETGVVMEGRDIGTVVFPDTPFKFYLDASVKERARRRKIDLEAAGYEVDVEELEREVARRDERDSTRSAAPLKRAEGAISIDTTGMSIEEVVGAIAEGVEAMLAGRRGGEE